MAVKAIVSITCCYFAPLLQQVADSPHSRGFLGLAVTWSQPSCCHSPSVSTLFYVPAFLTFFSALCILLFSLDSAHSWIFSSFHPSRSTLTPVHACFFSLNEISFWKSSLSHGLSPTMRVNPAPWVHTQGRSLLSVLPKGPAFPRAHHKWPHRMPASHSTLYPHHTQHTPGARMLL